MSVLVTVRVAGDVDRFRSYIDGEGAERLRENAELAKQSGAISHRFGVGDGFVMAVDEWESPEKFQEFFSRPELGELIAEAGGSGEPEIAFAEAISSPDQF
jgi:hypothetical protein